jgi:hypothetical protein
MQKVNLVNLWNFFLAEGVGTMAVFHSGYPPKNRSTSYIQYGWGIVNLDDVCGMDKGFPFPVVYTFIG